MRFWNPLSENSDSVNAEHEFWWDNSLPSIFQMRPWANNIPKYFASQSQVTFWTTLEFSWQFHHLLDKLEQILYEEPYYLAQENLQTVHTSTVPVKNHYCYLPVIQLIKGADCKTTIPNLKFTTSNISKKM